MRNTCLFLLVFFCCEKTLLAQEKNKSKIYYSLEQLDEDEYYETKTFPRPIFTKTELVNYLRSKAFYPEFDKKYFHQLSITVPLTIGVDGKGTMKQAYSSHNSAIEEQAISILTDTALKWQPCIKGKKNIETRIRVPVRYRVTFENDKMYFHAGFFIGLESLKLDSTDSYPALWLDTAKNIFLNNEAFLMTPASWEPNKKYGTVTIAVEVDTTGKLNEFKLITPVAKELDELAMSYLQKTSGKWIPARKNGQKIASYKYFNCFFNDVYVSPEKFTQDYIPFRNYFEINYNRGYHPSNSVAHFDYNEAMDLQSEKKYEAALPFFDKAALYFIKDANLFYNRALCRLQTGKNEKGCDDLQRVLDIAEVTGFPHGISKESVEQLMYKYCQ